MSKIMVKVEADKLRSLIETETYTNKDGEQISKQVVKFDLVAKKPESQKTVYEGKGYDLVDSHYAMVPQTAEERASKADITYIGGGVSVVWENQPQSAPQPVGALPDSGDDDLPF